MEGKKEYEEKRGGMKDEKGEKERREQVRDWGGGERRGEGKERKGQKEGEREGERSGEGREEVCIYF